MDKFKKIDKEFLLTDSSLNSYSYRLLSSGYLMSEFKKNPIGYYMHGKEGSEFPREMGVLVKWDDLRADGDKVFGKPCINLSHPRGQRTVDEIESGFLNGASVGHIVAIEVSSELTDYLEGQTGPTVKKWYNRECSLVDIPGNYNALKDLFDEQDNPINLADFTPQKLKMKQIFFTPAQLTLMNLKADADEATVTTAFANLVAKAGKADQLQTELTTATNEKNTAVKDLADFKTAAAQTEVKDLCAAACNVDKKITKEVALQLEKDYSGNPAGLKSLLAAIPAPAGVVKSITGAGGAAKDLAAMTYDELDKAATVVKKNLNVFPQVAVNRTDSELTYAIDTYYALPRQIQDIESYELSYDKRQSVVGEDMQALIQQAMNGLLYRWAPKSATNVGMAANIILTDGPATAEDLIDDTAAGARSTFTKNAFKKVAKKYANTDNPGRITGLLTANHYHQFFESLSDAEKTNFNNVADLKNGIIGRYMGIDILTRSSVLRYRGADLANLQVVDEQADAFAPSADDRAASLFYSDNAVERAKGDVNVFDNPGQALYYAGFSIMLATVVTAQSTRKVTQADTSINATGSTISFTNMASKLMSIQASVVKISGTLAGEVYLDGTIDGNWIAQDSLVLADAAVATKLFPITRTNFLNYRIRYVPTGTQTSRVTATYLRRTDDNGNLLKDIDAIDGIAGIGETVQTVGFIGKCFQVFNLLDAETQGITEVEEPFMHRRVKGFYDEVAGNQELWLMGLAETMTMAQALDNNDEEGLKKLVRVSNGRVRKLGVCRHPDAGYNAGNAFFDDDVEQAVLKANTFCQARLAELVPLRVLIEGRVNDEDSLDIFEPKTANVGSAGVVLGSTLNDGSAAVETLLGRAVKYGAHIKVGKVANGPLSISQVFIGTKLLKDVANLDALHGKGIISFMNHPSKAGFYFGVDRMASTDDYRLLAFGLVVDKAAIVAAQTYVDELEGEAEVDDNGNISELELKHLEDRLRQQVLAVMPGQISGLIIYINPNQDIINTNRLLIKEGNEKPSGSVKLLKFEVDLMNDAAQAIGYAHIGQVPKEAILITCAFKKTATNANKNSMKAIRAKEREEKEKAQRDACEVLALARYGEEHIKHLSNKNKGLWYLPVYQPESDEIAAMAIMRPIDRHVLSYASTKITDEGLYAFLESCMNECFLEGDRAIIDDDEFFLPASSAFNKILEGHMMSGGLVKLGQNAQQTFTKMGKAIKTAEQHSRQLGQSFTQTNQKLPGTVSYVGALKRTLKEAADEAKRLAKEMGALGGGGGRGAAGAGDIASAKRGGGLGGLVRMAMPYISAAAIASFGMSSVKAANQFDAQKTSYGVLAGNKGIGNAIADDLRGLKENTIMGPAVYKNAQMMLGFGIAAKDINHDLRMLGDISMGDANRLQHLTLAFSEVQAAGKLTGKEVRQFVNAGFNPLMEISKMTGKSMAEVRHQMHEGKITAQQLTQAFESATGEGGRFHGMLEKMANTALGKGQMLEGRFASLKIALGERLQPAFIQSTDSLIKWVTWAKHLVEIPVEQKLQEEINKIKSLQAELVSSNTNHARQVEILKELEQINPNIVKGINEQSISYADLARNVDKVTQSLGAKIFAERFTKDNADVLEKYNSAKEQQASAMGKVMSAVGQAFPGIAQDDKLTLGQKQALTKQRLMQMVDKTGDMSMQPGLFGSHIEKATPWLTNPKTGVKYRVNDKSDANRLLIELQQGIFAANQSADVINSTSGQVAVINKTKEALLKQFGISSGVESMANAAAIKTKNGKESNANAAEAGNSVSGGITGGGPRVINIHGGTFGSTPYVIPGVSDPEPMPEGFKISEQYQDYRQLVTPTGSLIQEKIGPYKPFKPNAIKWKRSIDSYSDSSLIKVPSVAMLKSGGDVYTRVESGLQFKEGMKVEVACGYNGNNLVRFKGFVRRINYTLPCEIECEGYSYQLRLKQNINKVYPKGTKMKTVLVDLVEGTDIKLSSRIPDVTVASAIVFKRATGVQVLDWFKDKMLQTVYFNYDELYVGLKETELKGTVRHRLGWNVIKDNDLKFNDHKEHAEVKIQLQSRGVDGGFVKEVYDTKYTNTKVKRVQVRFDAAYMAQMAKDYKASLLGWGYEGMITTFAVPYVEPGMVDSIEDPRYQERNGRYFNCTKRNNDMIDLLHDINGELILAGEDLATGVSDLQHQQDLLLADKGSIPQYLEAGVGAATCMKAQGITLATDANRPDWVTMFNSTSRVATWKIIFYACAFCINMAQQLFDLFRIETDDKISRLKPHSARWFAEKAKAFQYGFNLVAEADYYNNTGLTEAQIIASQVVAYAAVVEQQRGIRIKVARLVNNELAALTVPQLDAFTAYMEQIKPAGIKLLITTGPADDLKSKLRVYYNPLVLLATGGRIDGTDSEPVQNALKTYLKNLPFNGLFVPMLAVDAMQKVDGVEIIKDEYWQARYGALPYNGIDYEYNPDAGFLRRIDFTQNGGFPATQYMTKYMQDSFRNCFMALAGLIGDKVIVSGMDVVGGQITNGWISYNGELMPFLGGPTETEFIIEELPESRLFNDNTTKDVYFKKQARFGSPGITFADLKRVSTIIAFFESFNTLVQTFDDFVTDTNLAITDLYAKIKIAYVSFIAVGNPAANQLINVVHNQDIAGGNYLVSGSLVSLGADYNQDNDTVWMNILNGKASAETVTNLAAAVLPEHLNPAPIANFSYTYLAGVRGDGLVRDSILLNGVWVKGIATDGSIDSTANKIASVKWVLEWILTHGGSGGGSGANNFLQGHTFDTLTGLFSSTRSGLSPVSVNIDGRYVKLTGSYANPSWLTSVAWGKLTGVPSTFAPSAHTHAESEVTNLVSDLAGKAPTSHNHTLSQLSQSGATTNQVAQWNGSAWVPATVSTGGYTPPGDNTKILDGTGAAITPTKSLVGLGSVDNTPDASKPVSTAQAAAIALKYDATNPAGYVTSAGAASAAPVQSVAGKTGTVSLVKGDVGLGSVDNTADASKPVSTAQAAAIALKYDATNPAGYVTSAGAASAAPVQSVAGKTGTVSLVKGDVGLGSVDNTADASKPVSTAQAAAIALKYDATNPAGYVTSAGAASAAPVQSVAGKTGTVSLVKGDVGLGSVDNTADASKPVSTAQQAALNIKLDSIKAINDSTFRQWKNGTYTDVVIKGGKVKLQVDYTRGLSTIGDSMLTMDLKTVDGVSPYGNGNIVTTGRGKWYTVTEAPTVVIDLDSGKLQKVSLTANRLISFTHVHEGSYIELWFYHLTAGAKITNMPADEPWDRQWATGLNERTVYKGTYDSAAGVWNWSVDVHPVSTSMVMVQQSEHEMTAYLKLTPNKYAYFTAGKALGITHKWWHTDIYTDSLSANGYRATIKKSADTLAIVGGMTFTPGLSGAMSVKEMKQMTLDFINHPAIYKNGGKPVIAVYNFDSLKFVQWVDTMAAYGYASNSYLRMVSTSAYPQYQYWLTPARWVNNVGVIEDSASAAQVYNFNPLVDGLMNFSGDKATSIDSLAKNRVILENSCITKASNARGKLSYAGYTVMYHNDAVQNWDIGLRGADSVLMALVNMPVNNRPTFVGPSTSNDMNELTNAGAAFTTVTNGVFYQPDLSAHYYEATGAFPSMDKSGITEFFRPHMNALKNGATTLSYPQNRIVAKYGLHPRNATPSNVIPSALVPYRYADSLMITQTKWNASRAANTPAWVAGNKWALYDRIEMAVWLTDSAYLVINGNVSPTKYGPGKGFYSIAAPTTGLPIIPSFAIRVGGTDIVSVSGSQAITTSTWPGHLLAIGQGEKHVWNTGNTVYMDMDSGVATGAFRMAVAPVISSAVYVFVPDPTTGYTKRVLASSLVGSGSGTVKILQYLVAATKDSTFAHDSIRGRQIDVYRSGKRLYPGVDYIFNDTTVTFRPFCRQYEPIRIEYGSFNVTTIVPGGGGGYTPPAVLRDLVLETRTAGLSASGTSPRNYDGGTTCGGYLNTGVSDSILPASYNGRIQWQTIGTNSNNCIVGLKASATNEPYRTGSVNNFAVGAMRLGTELYVLNGIADIVGTGINVSGDIYLSINKTGTVYTLETSTTGVDGSWTVRYTFSYTDNVNLHGCDYWKLYEFPSWETIMLRNLKISSVADTVLVLDSGIVKKVHKSALGFGSATWGSIGGTLSSQTDLVSALAGKAATTHTHAESDITGLVSDLAGKAATSHSHALSDWTQSGATTNQVAQWNGSAWAPATLSGGSNWTISGADIYRNSKVSINNAAIGDSAFHVTGGEHITGSLLVDGWIRNPKFWIGTPQLGTMFYWNADGSLSQITGTSGQYVQWSGGAPIFATADASPASSSINAVQSGGVFTALAGKADKVITTQGDLVIGNVSGIGARLPIGSNTQVLTSNGTTASWQTPSSGFANPMTTAGDVIYGGSGGAGLRLPAGTSTQVLHSGTTPSWGAVGLTTDVSGILPVANGGTGTASPGIVQGTGITVTGTWPNQTVNTSAMVSPMTTIGDLIQGTTAGAPARLASVATGNALISGGVGTASSWGKIGLTTHVSGTLPVANGGTGATASTGSGNVVLATSPSLAGTPLATTATAGTNTTQIATTEFVTNATPFRYSATADVTVANTTTLTTLLSATQRGSNILAANSLIVGSRVIMEGEGIISTAASGTAFVMNLKNSSSSINCSGILSLSLTNSPVEFSGAIDITQTNGGNTLASGDTLAVTGTFSSTAIHGITGTRIFIDASGATVTSPYPAYQQDEWYDLDGVTIAGFYFHNWYGFTKMNRYVHDCKLLNIRVVNDAGSHPEGYINQPWMQWDKAATTDMVFAGAKSKTFYNDTIQGCYFDGFANTIVIRIGSNWNGTDNEINRSIALDFRFIGDTFKNVIRTTGGSVGAISGTGFKCYMDKMVFQNIDGVGSANASHNETVLWYGTIRMLRSRQSGCYAAMLRNVALAWTGLPGYRNGEFSAWAGNIVDHQLSYSGAEFTTSNAGNRNTGNGFYPCQVYSVYNSTFNTVARSYNSPYYYYGFAGCDVVNVDTVTANYNAGSKIERDYLDFRATWDSVNRKMIVAVIGGAPTVLTTTGNRIFETQSSAVFLDTAAFVPGFSLKLATPVLLLAMGRLVCSWALYLLLLFVQPLAC
ncbi:tape measure domain protein [Ostertagia ostertagi]